jgi:membrane protein DedA with SNARE-associated domain
MLRFTLKQMFASTILIGVGIVMLICIHAPWYPLRPGFVIWNSAGALIGAGICSLYKRPWLGAIIGAVIGAGIQYEFLISSFSLE